MTRDDIMRLDGRELDAVVADLVMGLTVDWPEGEEPTYYVPEASPRIVSGALLEYSFDIRAAWEVVGKMRESHGLVLTQTHSGWDASFHPNPFTDAVIASPYGFKSGEAEANTAPLAICRAALLAWESTSEGDAR